MAEQRLVDANKQWFTAEGRQWLFDASGADVTWEGGRVRWARERPRWVIERRVGGERKSVTLDAHSEKEALVQLALFEHDPLGYRTKRETVAASPGAAVLSDATLKLFGEYCIKQGLSEHYRNHTLKTYLTEWAAALRGRDLRRVTLPTLLAQLDDWETARHHRIVALKAFTSWMRETARLHRGEDPTMDLKVPSTVAEKSVRPKGYTMELVQTVYASLSSQVLRDTLCLRAKTGMHDTEISRIAEKKAVLKRLDDPNGITGTITFRHEKAGKVHVVSVDAQTYAAAERLQARGMPLSRNAAKSMLDREAVRRHGCGGITTKTERTRLRKGRTEAIYETKACEQCEPIQPGELRHSFATWARARGRLVQPTEGGVPLAEVAAVMGHLNPRTTKVFYEGNEVPPMIALPLRLLHPEDPTPLVRAHSGQAARADANRSS